MEKELTEHEWELVEAIRNYRKGQHNPSRKIEEYVRELFENILEEEEN